MSDSIGERLKHARMARGASLEEAARATKIRVPRLSDMENEDFSNFASLVYAKGFLKNYADYLGIDISDYIEALGAEGGVASDNYQYLAHAPSTHEKARRKPRSKLPQIIGTSVVVLLILLGVLAWMFIDSSLKRLDTLEDDASFVGVEEEQTPDETTSATPATPATPAPPVAGTSPAATPQEPAAQPPPAAGIAADDDGIPVARAVPANADNASGTTEPTVRRAVPVRNPTLSDPPPENAPIYEVSLNPMERTWVKVIKNDIASQPVYEDWLSPDEESLTVSGRKFWITVMDRGAVEVRKNGQVVAFDGTALVIE